MADTAAPADTSATRPVKPDEDAFKTALNKAEKAHKDVMTRFNAIKAKIEIAQPKKDGPPSPAQKRRQELIAQLTEIRQKQAGSKSSRTSKQEQIKRLDEQLRSRIAEQKASRGKVPFKSTEELDAQVRRLEAQVEGGMMALVEEKKALAEITSLRKMRKSFAALDAQEKQIAELKASIKQIKDGMEDPAAKALGEQYNTLQAELDGLKAEQDTVYKSLNSLRDERSKLHAEQRETFDAIRKLKDAYYSQKKAFAAYEREARNRAWERKQAERERIERERKKERAQRLLAEASDPAYLDELRRARSLLAFFDPAEAAKYSAAAAAAAAANGGSNGSTGLDAPVARKVDDSGLKGMRILSKKDRDDDYLPAAKKGGKKGGKKNSDTAAAAAAATAAAAPAASSSSKGFSVPPAVIEDCASMGLNPPVSAADVPTVVEQIKAKLQQWESDQAAQTQKNIEKAKKEIEKLEKEEEAAAAGGSGKKTGEGEDKAVAEVTADLKDSSLAEKKEEEEEAEEAPAAETKEAEATEEKTEEAEEAESTTAADEETKA